ncbi:hypothetical protein GCM10025869_18130 [Homoserinibacter gongjuensis]|uniref:FAD-binding FR-type domain-containing protein n=1 Tax=Homoserinibacter gongjuensis TaxID=1162968 RepID=A0ABQ6JVI7_9MICO|nr:hypothetical protein GCM10025869_18130 [Homoserinibacter gongjuensis]
MLSEPLTLPPRRWQRLAYAVVVALLATVPYTVGPFRTTPELALVIGGVLAFLLGQRRAVRLEFIGRRQLTPTAWEFRFRPMAPLRFDAGQYLELTLPHPHPDARGIRRVFSITSAPGDAELTIGVRIRDEASSFKRALLALVPGARVRATGVWGISPCRARRMRNSPSSRPASGSRRSSRTSAPSRARRAPPMSRSSTRCARRPNSPTATSSPPRGAA